jgi:hypothetical protein
VEPDVVALWRDVAGLVEHPAAIARFHDLLFERRDGRRDEHAAAAAQGYLAAARPRSRADLDVAAFLVRAWDLARSVGLWGLLTDVQSELHSKAEKAMSSGGAALPGVVLPMIAALAAPVPRRQPQASVPDPAAVDLLLETAFTKFRAGFLASQVAAMMRSRTSDPVAIKQVNRREVAAHRAEAAASGGFARQAHLAGAIGAQDRAKFYVLRHVVAGPDGLHFLPSRVIRMTTVL